jgi:hypothetical protein
LPFQIIDSKGEPDFAQSDNSVGGGRSGSFHSLPGNSTGSVQRVDGFVEMNGITQNSDKGVAKMSQLPHGFDKALPEKQLTKDEMFQALRHNVAAEHEAIHRYLAQAASIDHVLAKTILTEIASEKRVHVGELERLLEMLTGDSFKSVAEGRERVDELAAELAGLEAATNEKNYKDVWDEASESLDQLGI